MGLNYQERETVQELHKITGFTEISLLRQLLDMKKLFGERLMRILPGMNLNILRKSLSSPRCPDEVHRMIEVSNRRWFHLCSEIFILCSFKNISLCMISVENSNMLNFIIAGNIWHQKENILLWLTGRLGTSRKQTSKNC